MKTRFLLVLERLESIFKRCRPKSFSAGPPAPLDLAFPWISITGKAMLPSEITFNQLKYLRKKLMLDKKIQ
jgi:hypothetical protein